MNRLAFAASLGLRLPSRHAALTRHIHAVRARPAERRPRHATWATASPSTTTATPEEEVDPGVVEGTSLRILKYPHPLLRSENAEFTKAELPEARRLAKDMLKVMYASRGVGLAAPQVGVNRRLLVFNTTADPKKWTHETILVNPRIVASSKAGDVETEACLSFPDMSGPVRRAEWVKVEAQRASNGKTFRIKYEGWKARVFQHEYDHLDGVLYVDRLENEDRANVKETLDSLIANYNAEPYQDMKAAL